MRYIQCARHREEQNLFVFQYLGNVYYRAFKDISQGTELLVWYDEIYPQYMGIPLSIHDMADVNIEGKSFYNYKKLCDAFLGFTSRF